MSITLDQFLAKQFIGKPEAQAFRKWLGSLANDKYPQGWWLRLWNEFLNEQKST